MAISKEHQQELSAALKAALNSTECFVLTVFRTKPEPPDDFRRHLLSQAMPRPLMVTMLRQAADWLVAQEQEAQAASCNRTKAPADGGPADREWFGQGEGG
jgi:hypothetical protein